MNSKKYQEIVNKHIPKENKNQNLVTAFVVGGSMGVLANFLLKLYTYVFHISTKEASGYMLITFIFVACLLTGLGIFDNLVQKGKMGLIIPITQYYPTELKKNKNNLEKIAKAKKETENLKKSQAAATELRKSHNNEAKNIEDFETMFLNIEKNRVNDDKCIISHFIHSELKYHCAAIQKLSELFSHINKTNVNTGLVKFADDYGIKNFNFKDLGIDMDELKKSKLKKEEEENKKKKSVFEEDNKNEDSEDDDNNTESNGSFGRSQNK